MRIKLTFGSIVPKQKQDLLRIDVFEGQSFQSLLLRLGLRERTRFVLCVHLRQVPGKGPAHKTSTGDLFEQLKEPGYFFSDGDNEFRHRQGPNIWTVALAGHLVGVCGFFAVCRSKQRYGGIIIGNLY